MNSEELRKKFLEFFKEKGHAIIPGASLIPEHDPTVLFTTAGMHPLVPYLLGEKHPAGRRLANVQKCIRTGDIDSVGDRWHLTFFEMLGNWSLGDPDAPDGIGAGYWKKEAIEWSVEFLTGKKWLKIPKEKLSVTVFAGDRDAPADEESARIWQSLGIPKERIFYLGKEENWWGPAGKTGPCGPCTEMFYDTGKEKCGDECRPGCDCGKYSEIWNDVFMEYEKKIKNQKSKIKNGIEEMEDEYEFVPLKQKNVDTGMGVERTTAVLNGYDSVYETELFKPIILEIKKIAKISELPVDSFEKLYNPGQIVVEEIADLKEKAEKERAIRIIGDHIKAATFILAEGIEPSNVERGYVLRRLIRRAIRYGKQLEINDIFTFKIAKVVIEIYKDIYPELKKNKNFIEEQLVREEEKFGKTLERGLRQFKVQSSKFKVQNKKNISGKIAFDLYQTYGFPLELTKELAEEEGLSVDSDEFQKLFAQHQELSRTATAGTFKSGLADHSEQVVKYHTATHLLLAALRKILGEHVTQKGSNITAERMRFDFSHPEKMREDQIKQVEDLVNQKIKEDLPVKMEEMKLEEAKKSGAMGVFGEKYGEKVKVYSIGDFSKEICGGPHVERTGMLGKFKIIKEESIAAGVRRIKAMLG
jgi:alanyl-tRNA synthetase